jgi:histidinol-phosphate phosphatase family protein
VRPALTPAIFLDRDGTLNIEVPIVANPDELILIEGAAAAVRRINDAGFLAILLTNQAIVARGDCNQPMLSQIHHKLRRDLESEGARLDAIYFCPHHPDWGPPCSCRKPKPGMLRAAQSDFDIDLARSWVIGDSAKDIELARNAGVRCVLVRTGKAGSDMTHTVPDRTCDTLGEAVDYIVRDAAL